MLLVANQLNLWDHCLPLRWILGCKSAQHAQHSTAAEYRAHRKESRCGLNAQPRIRPLGSMLATQLNRRHLGPLLWAHTVVSSSSPRLLVDSITFASPEYEGLGAISAAHDSTESLPPPQPTSAIYRPPILDMRGGGMLWFWSAGVLSYLQQQQDLAAVRLHGSSSGAIAAALAACDVPLELAAQRVAHVLAEHGVHDR